MVPLKFHHSWIFNKIPPNRKFNPNRKIPQNREFLVIGNNPHRYMRGCQAFFKIPPSFGSSIKSPQTEKSLEIGNSPQFATPHTHSASLAAFRIEQGNRAGGPRFGRGSSALRWPAGGGQAFTLTVVDRWKWKERIEICTQGCEVVGRERRTYGTGYASAYSCREWEWSWKGVLGVYTGCSLLTVDRKKSLISKLFKRALKICYAENYRKFLQFYIMITK